MLQKPILNILEYFNIINTVTSYASNDMCLDHKFMKSKTVKFYKPLVSPMTITDQLF